MAVAVSVDTRNRIGATAGIGAGLAMSTMAMCAFPTCPLRFPVYY
jgi:hypothetical protein